MSRQIIIRDGVFYDEKWNAITPTHEELEAITETVFKYASINKGAL